MKLKHWYSSLTFERMPRIPQVEQIMHCSNTTCIFSLKSITKAGKKPTDKPAIAVVGHRSSELLVYHMGSIRQAADNCKTLLLTPRNPKENHYLQTDWARDGKYLHCSSFTKNSTSGEKKIKALKTLIFMPHFYILLEKKYQRHAKRNGINGRLYFKAILIQVRIFLFTELIWTTLFSIWFNWKVENEILHFFLINNSKLLAHRRLECFSFPCCVHKTDISMM